MEKVIHKYRKHIVLSILIVAVLLLITSYHLFLFRIWPQPISQNPVNVAVTTISSVNKPIWIDREGYVGKSSSIPINTDYSGQVTEIYVTEGQPVKAGQPLIKIETSPDHESLVENQKPGSSSEAQENYETVLKEFKRYQKLYEQGAIPRRQLDNVAARLQAAKDSLTANQNTSSVNTNSNFSGSVTIAATIDGIVTGLAAAPGKAVQAGQQLMALGSGQEVEAVVHLDQKDLYMVHLGTSAAIGVSNQAILGQVSSIYPVAEADQVLSFLAHVKLLSNSAGLLEPGKSVSVRLDSGESAIVAAVPTTSVRQDDQGNKYVYIVSDGKAIRQQIRTGETVGDFIEVISDIPQDMMIVTGNIDGIANGDAVTVVQ